MLVKLSLVSLKLHKKHGQLHFDKTKMALVSIWRLDLKNLYATHLDIVRLSMLFTFDAAENHRRKLFSLAVLHGLKWILVYLYLLIFFPYHDRTKISALSEMLLEIIWNLIFLFLQQKIILVVGPPPPAFSLKRITHKKIELLKKNLQFHKQYCYDQLALFGNNNNKVNFFHSSLLMNYLPFSCQTLLPVLVPLLSNVLYWHVNIFSWANKANPIVGQRR